MDIGHNLRVELAWLGMVRQRQRRWYEAFFNVYSPVGLYIHFFRRFIEESEEEGMHGIWSLINDVYFGLDLA